MVKLKKGEEAGLNCVIFELFFVKKKYLLVGASGMLWVVQ